MKNIEFTILSHGYSFTDPGYVVAGYNFGDKNEPKREREWLKFPCFSVLIKHPSAGLILYDLGPAIGVDKDRAPEINISNPFYIKREEFIDKKLEALGLSVKDIDAILISHCHWDHIGGLMFFSGTKAGRNVYLPKKDFISGLVATHISSKGFSGPPYYKAHFENEEIDFSLIDQDVELFPGIEVFLLRGHSPSVMGIILHLESKTFIFPGDTVNSTLNYGPPMRHPGMAEDTFGITQSTKKLYEMQKKYNAKLIFPHDAWEFDKIKLAPYFYK